MIVLSHFKGHPLSGFGGAIKNLAMGCAPAAGKADQHLAKPIFRQELCIGCSRCAEACPSLAISVEIKISILISLHARAAASALGSVRFAQLT